MLALWGRKLSVAEQEGKLAFVESMMRRGRRLNAREAEVRRVLTELRDRRARYEARPRGRYLSLAAIVAELGALEQLQRERSLTHDESERLGWLVAAEQKRARTRPARIARLKVELELLETLEIAQRGPVALAVVEPREVEMTRGIDGAWRAEREAA